MGFHIFRREAVYYWRRRPPRVLANLFDRQHLFVSLKTTSHIVARRLAAQLDLILKDAAMLAEGDLNLSRSQIETMFRGVVDGHLAKLDRIALAAKSAPGFDPERTRIDDKRAFWTYALLEAQGFAAVVRAEDRDRMTADGLANADIEAVQDHLAMLRSNGLVPTKHHILRQMIDAVGAVPTAMNIDVAQGTYFRAMKLALAEIDRRYGGRRAEDGGFVDRMLLSKVDPQQQVVSFPTGSDVRPSDPPSDENRPAAQCVAMADFSKFAEDVMSQNAKDGHWDDKTQR